MRTRKREQSYIERQRRLLSRDDGTASSNIAAAYRVLGRYRLAFRWWSRAAESGDGDAFVDLGYCYQHGLGVRQDELASEQAYRAAIATHLTTPAGREEAMYHLAVLLLLRGEKEEALTLLGQASGDEDYPAASALLRALRGGQAYQPCQCRRGLLRRLATVKCPLHRGTLAMKPL